MRSRGVASTCTPVAPGPRRSRRLAFLQELPYGREGWHSGRGVPCPGDPKPGYTAEGLEAASPAERHVPGRPCRRGRGVRSRSYAPGRTVRLKISRLERSCLACPRSVSSRDEATCRELLVPPKTTRIGSHVGTAAPETLELHVTARAAFSSDRLQRSGTKPGEGRAPGPGARGAGRRGQTGRDSELGGGHARTAYDEALLVSLPVALHRPQMQGSPLQLDRGLPEDGPEGTREVRCHRAQYGGSHFCLRTHRK